MNPISDGKNQVETLYPVTGIQRGMIFHSLLSPESGVYVLQDGARLSGSLHIEAFWQAWDDVIARHAVFRSLFVRMDTAKPVQVVLRRASMPRMLLDWRDRSAADQALGFEEFLREERARGFDFGKAPLMRVVLIRCTEDACFFVWTRHHVLLDGWSGPIVLRDMLQCYAARLQGDEPALPPVGSYQDYVRWLGARDHAAATGFWQRYLHGFDSRTPLPLRSTADGRRADEHLVFQSCQTALSVVSGNRLRAMARDLRITLNVVVQAAWALLLARYTDRDEVLFGTTVSGRPADMPGVEGIVGPFINSIPLRVHVRTDRRLDAWLRELQDAGLERSSYEFLPLADIQAQCAMADQGGLFDTLLVFDNYPLGSSDDERMSGLRAEFVSSFSYNNYPLTLMVVPDETIVLHFKYDGSRYGTGQIEQLLESLVVLLEGMADDPARRVRDLSPMTTATQRAIARCEDGGRLVAGCSTLLEAFQSAATQAADRDAVVCGDTVRSYGWLHAHSSRLAHWLLAAAVAPEARVGVLLSRGERWPLAMLGTLKAGACFVPLDPEWPEARIAQVVQDAGIDIIITEQAHLLRAASVGEGELLSLDRDWEDLLDCPELDPRLVVRGEQLAYVIYTSGSTGRPKGVCVSHAAVAAYVSGVMQRLAVDERAEMAALSTLSADLGYTAVLGALGSGRTLRILPEECMLDAQRLAQTLRERPIDVLKIVPSHLQALLEAAGKADVLPRQCLVLGGESPAPLLLARVRQSASCAIVNHYGPTETTVGALATTLVAGDPITVGTPMAGRRAYVLDRHGRTVPDGVAGELHLGGVGLARGYWADPRLTAERFVPDAFSPEPGSRMYHTGDLVRRHRDGRISFLGRRDHQIKLRGNRIELGEVESFAGSLSGVCGAVATLWQAQGQPPALVAYVVGDSLDETRLREAADRLLPKPLRPDHWVLLDALPLTANGKVDRKALPAPGAAPIPAYIAPRGRIEQLLTTVWSELLQRDRVSIDDNFFSLGGNSLLLIQLHGRICRELGATPGVADLFRYPTIRKFAEFLEGGSGDGVSLGDMLQRRERQREAEGIRATQESKADA